jgi:hypothetical protein
MTSALSSESPLLKVKDDTAFPLDTFPEVRKIRFGITSFGALRVSSEFSMLPRRTSILNVAVGLSGAHNSLK